MKIRDKEIKKYVDVYEKNCPNYECYWARPDPGIFTQGQGYRKASIDRGYICGTREIRGCPVNPVMIKKR
jgi:hypothetical protein